MGSYYHPSNIKEALQLAANNSGNYMYFSGGTDLQIYRKQGLENSETIIDLNAIEVSERILVKNASLQMSAF
ncbi:MAG TPA: FAD binding domain-containing protein, partial [Candidatus Marinimicrobia bacterium]|nr:FAD binding domain-containing protein [Candidatus Neomarinimicrobiota bacterium]